MVFKEAVLVIRVIKVIFVDDECIQLGLGLGLGLGPRIEGHAAEDALQEAREGGFAAR